MDKFNIKRFLRSKGYTHEIDEGLGTSVYNVKQKPYPQTCDFVVLAELHGKCYMKVKESPLVYVDKDAKLEEINEFFMQWINFN